MRCLNNKTYINRAFNLPLSYDTKKAVICLLMVSKKTLEQFNHIADSRTKKGDYKGTV